MAPEALPPNPLPSRAVANDISLLLASKSARLRNTALFRNNLSSAPTKPKSSQHTATAAAADDSSVFHPGGQNSGIGYVASSGSDRNKVNDAATATLRNKLLGKRKGRAGDGGGRRGGAESEEDEDEGRSGLGKRKKVKKVRREEDEEAPDVPVPVDAPTIQGGGEETTNVEEEDGLPETTGSAEDATPGQPEGLNPKKKKKKKSKNKNKRE